MPNISPDAMRAAADLIQARAEATLAAARPNAGLDRLYGAVDAAAYLRRHADTVDDYQRGPKSRPRPG